MPRRRIRRGRMPSTMKCSQDDNLCVLACSNISGRIAAAASASSNRCRFLANSECSKLRSIMFEYKNHLNSPPGADTTAVCRTAARCTENTPINRPAYSRRSESISARPLAAYIREKVGESLDNARSTLGLMRRMGWRASFPLISNTTLPRWPILPHGAHIGAIFNTLPGKPAISRTSGLRRCHVRSPSPCRMRHRFRCGCTWGRGCCDGGPRAG